VTGESKPGTVSSRPHEFWVIDASMGDGTPPYCFIPVEFDEAGEVKAFVIGMNYISTEPPDGTYFIGVIHEDGQDATDAWCAERDEFLQDLFKRRGKKPEFA